MITIESIVRELRELPASKLAEVARYVHGLNADRQEKRRLALNATAACMKGPEGEDFENGVRAEGERIDVDWS